MNVNVIKSTMNELPKYETVESAGCDLRADLWEVKEKFLFNAKVVRDQYSVIKNITIAPGGRALIPTGLQIALPVGYEAQVRPRSGMSIKHGITLINCVGTIDEDYRGEVCVPIVNISNETYTIQPQERIAQMLIAKTERAKIEVVTELTDTTRGAGGFGSTGK